MHNEIYELHKESADASVGFQIEFLQFNVLKDDDTKPPPDLLVEEAHNVVVKTASSKKDSQTDYVLIPRTKRLKRGFTFSRKRSWVWNYFDKLDSTIYGCKLCNVLLSIKGCNSNNMNRHIRSRHPTIYKSEVEDTDIVSTNEKDVDELSESISKHRRSWIWSYFKRVSSTLAQCNLCNRNICHGGNATGNMNRHLKMIHNKTRDDTSWVWKVFECNEDYFLCRICQYKCYKFEYMLDSINNILDHLRTKHRVVSGDQIITGTDCEVIDNATDPIGID